MRDRSDKRKESVLKYMKVVTIVGARPQFIKCAPVSRHLRLAAHEVLLHTGQHYDENMSRIFFEQLDIPEPDYNLNVGSGSHGLQTAQMLHRIENILTEESPECVLVYGDTNSTLAGALAAVKLQIPVAHVEAGLRSFNRRMPEEINRVVTDQISSLYFCPTQTAVNNLANEGMRKGVYLVGDVMYDALKENIEKARQISTILDKLNLRSKGYILVTIHRAENTDDRVALKNICDALVELSLSGETIIFAAHPRTLKRLEMLGERERLNKQIIEPLPYLDMLLLQESAKLLITDSGGMQKEALWLSVPCVTLRHDTEWTETLKSGWNTLAGNEKQNILSAVRESLKELRPAAEFKDYGASKHLVEILCKTSEHGLPNGASVNGRKMAAVQPSS